jgi:polysaccharide export outer membrane protein
MISSNRSTVFVQGSALALALTLLAAVPDARAQGQAAPAPTPAGTSASPAVAPPADYVIGPEDVLAVLYWREKDLSAEVTVRSDGKISLPLLNDVEAAGLTPIELRDRLMEASQRFVADPNVTVVVRQMNSRKVFITGEVAKPGPYPLTGPTTVLQLIALAGGLREYADAKNISILRTEKGRPISFRFNYKDVASRKNLGQNIELKSGDTIVVP